MNIKSLLEKYNVKITNERSNDYDCLCPLHKDSSPSFSIRKDDGVWLCRSGCGSGSPLFLVARLEKCSIEEARAKLRDIISLNAQISDRISALKKKNEGTTTAVRLLEPIEYPYSFIPFNESCGILGHQDYYQYITRRIPIEAAKYFKLGFCNDGYYIGRVIIPVIIDGALVGFTARSIDPHAAKRYLIPSGVYLSRYIWGYDQEIKSTHAWLCESIFDAMTLWSWGYNPVFATFGANISNEQIELLIRRGITKITLCFHNDKAGIDAIQRKAEQLNSIFSTSYVNLPETADVNEMTRDDFDKLKITKLMDDENLLNNIKNKIRSKRK